MSSPEKQGWIGLHLQHPVKQVGSKCILNIPWLDRYLAEKTLPSRETLK